MCSLSFPLIIPDFHSLPSLLGGPGIMTTTDDSNVGCHAGGDPNSHAAVGGDISGLANVTQTVNGKTTPRSSSSSSSSSSPDQPDSDTIKMFVGQVPRSMDEHQLRVMFEDFGPVFQINVLRDKISGQSKGCCFVTFYTRKSALDAQNALHNVKTLPGMHHPIQMKPADTENRNERKLFVGMVSKKLSENDVRVLFSTFGTIEECTVLRDTNGVSKGCAFVTFSSRQCAIVAIKAMHHSQTMEGCSSPLVVKFADTQKDKEQKKVQQLQSNLWSLAGISSPPPSNVLPTPAYLTTLPQIPTLNGLTAVGHQSVTSPQNPSMSALQVPQMTSSSGINLNMLNLQQLLTGSPLTLPNGSTVVNTTSTGQAGYSAMMTAAPTTTSAPSMVTPSFVLPTSGGGNLGDQQQQLTSSLLANYPGLNLSGYLQSNAGQTLSNQNQVSLAFGLPTSTLNAASLAHYMSGTAGLQALAAAGLQQGHHMVTPTNGYTARGLGLTLGGNTLQSIPVSDTDVISTNSHLTGIPSLLTSTAPSSISSYQGVIAQPQSAESAAMTAAAMQAAAAASGLSGLKQHEGPDGSNLFIYHLPQEFSDADLLQTFQPFGNIVSAKVFIDKQTNLSKCFGFVSYDNPVSAHAAIQAMNGFQVGTKRLKVQLKRSRDFGKPY